MLAGPSVPHHTSFQEVMESTHSPYHVACLPPRPQRSQHSSRLLWRGHAVGACASCGPVRRSPTSRSVEQLRAHPPHIRVIMLHISRYVRSWSVPPSRLPSSIPSAPSRLRMCGPLLRCLLPPQRTAVQQRSESETREGRRLVTLGAWPYSVCSDFSTMVTSNLLHTAVR